MFVGMPLGYRIVAAFMPGMTTQDALDRKAGATYSTVLLDSLFRVAGTAGRVTT